MRTGERGIFPAFYAHEVIGQSKELLGKLRDASTVFSSVSLWRSKESHVLYVCVHLAPCRNETKSSLDWDFQRSVFGVCWGTLSPRQRYSLCCHAEGKLIVNTEKRHKHVCYTACTIKTCLSVRSRYRGNGRYMCDLLLCVNWRLACKEWNWSWAWRMNMTPSMRYGRTNTWIKTFSHPSLFWGIILPWFDFVLSSFLSLHLSPSLVWQM